MQYCYCNINITGGRQYCYCNVISLEACSIVTALYIISLKAGSMVTAMQYHWRHVVLLLHIVLSLRRHAVLLLQCNITGGRQYCYCILYYHGMGAPIQCYNCNVLSLEVSMQ